MPSPAFLARLEEALRTTSPATKEELHRIKQRVAHALREPLPTDAELLVHLPDHSALLRTKPMRSQSGVAVVAVMSSPAGCPHGKCVYCPGGPEVGVPQSYTGHEPSTMRAIRWAYDPYRIVRSRLAHLARNGHPVEKVDIVVQGGTFPARNPAYQDWFLTAIYQALNEGPSGPDEDPPLWEGEQAWAALDAAQRDRRLQEAMRRNETAACRAIGLTIETKPDWCLAPHIDRMLAQGCTRVELGLQTLDEETLRLTHRGHGLAESRLAMTLARDAGLKICVHMMPGQPRRRRQEPPPPIPRERPGGTTEHDLDPDPEADHQDMRQLFVQPDWRPDMLKIYPTLVVQEGETSLKHWWRTGRYTPYDTAQARAVVARSLIHVPNWCRIQRVDRDIPTTHVDAGVKNSNLRQLVEKEAPWLQDLRHREAGARTRQGQVPDAARAVLVRQEYDAAGGRECFLSLEDPVADAVLGFLRLRLPSISAHRPEAIGAAMVRELKVLGQQTPLGSHGEDHAVQHRGLGTRLLAEAEEVAWAWGAGKVLVLAGPGVKPYYRQRGYHDLGPYVAKGHPCKPLSSTSRSSRPSSAAPST